MDLTSSLEANLEQGPAKFTKKTGKIGKFCYHKTQKLGENPNFEVISEIQRAKFGVFVTCIFGGKIWGSNKNFRGKFYKKHCWSSTSKLFLKGINYLTLEDSINYFPLCKSSYDVPLHVTMF